MIEAVRTLPPLWLWIIGGTAAALLLAYTGFRVWRSITDARDYTEIEALLRGERNIPEDVYRLIEIDEVEAAIAKLVVSYGVEEKEARRAVLLTHNAIDAYHEMQDEMAQIHPDHLSGRLLALIRADRWQDAVALYAKERGVDAGEAEYLLEAFEENLHQRGLL